MPAKLHPWDYKLKATRLHRFSYQGRFWFKSKREREEWRGYFLARASARRHGLQVDDQTLMRWAELRREDDELVASLKREQELRSALRKKYNIQSPKIPYQHLEELEEMRNARARQQ